MPSQLIPSFLLFLLGLYVFFQQDQHPRLELEDMEDEDEAPDDLLINDGKLHFEKTAKKREADKELKQPPPNYFISNFASRYKR